MVLESAGSQHPESQAGSDLAGTYPHPRLRPPEAFPVVNTAGEPLFLVTFRAQD